MARSLPLVVSAESVRLTMAAKSSSVAATAASAREEAPRVMTAERFQKKGRALEQVLMFFLTLGMCFFVFADTHPDVPLWVSVGILSVLGMRLLIEQTSVFDWANVRLGLFYTHLAMHVAYAIIAQNTVHTTVPFWFNALIPLVTLTPHLRPEWPLFPTAWANFLQSRMLQYVLALGLLIALVATGPPQQAGRWPATVSLSVHVLFIAGELVNYSSSD